MAYELNPHDILDFARNMAIEHTVKGNELFFIRCPYCNGGKHDKNTFSVNLETGAYKCFRSSCGKQGHFVELARDFNYKLDFKDNQGSKNYRKLPQAPVITKPKAVEFLEKRGISKAVTEKYNITVHKNNEKILVFPFFDENNVMAFVKYRNMDYNDHGSKEWCERDTKPILFGMNHCVDFERLIITEGQIDSLSVAEAGVDNAVSVPTGAMGFTFLEHVWDWIIKFKEVVVFGDNEGDKVTLSETLTRRLPNLVKVVQIEDYLGEKDANAILQKYGNQAIITAIEKAEAFPVKNVKELADVENVDIYNLPRVYTNIYEIDKAIGGFFFGQVILLTGKRGEGKSTFMSQLMVEAVEQGFSVFAYSGELVDYHFKRWFDLQCAGPDNVSEYKNQWDDTAFYLKQEIVDKLNNWYRGKVYIYDNNAVVSDDEFTDLLVTVEEAIMRYGVKLVCIDNLMTALDVSMKDDLYRAQSGFVRNLKLLAMKHNVVIVLVAHPRKSKDSFENDDVSGSGDITNRVDVVMSYSRNTDEEDFFDSKLSITKNRLLGKLAFKDDAIGLLYSKSTKRIGRAESHSKKYGWETDGGIEAIGVEVDNDGNPFM